MLPNPGLRRLAVYLLVLYGAGSFYFTLQGVIGQPLPIWTTPLLTLIAFAFACVHAAGRLGWRGMLLLLVLSAGISLAFESIGVATGLVYGPYHYTSKLGPRFLGLVPYLIPVAWFMMMYPSFLIASKLRPARGQRAAVLLAAAALGGLVMTAWDAVMDPMMVKAGHWVWDVQGVYFGVPLQNYWGWWLTTFTVFAIFLLVFPRALALTAPPTSQPVRSYDTLAVISYAITGASNAIAAWLMGLPGPAAVGLGLMAIFVIWWMVRRES